MMCRALVFVVCASAACSFEPGTLGGGSAIDDARRDSLTDGPLFDAPPDSPPADARICPAAPSGCTSFSCEGSSSCYYQCGTSTTGKLNYNAAVGACTSQSIGCVVTINDAAENLCVHNATLPMFPSSMIWLGYKQASNGAEPAGGWSWQCGTSSFLAGNWGDPAGEPNDTNNDEDCATMIAGTAWIDADCSGTARYVCELP
jgi:Lectin C-type domain